MPAPKHKPFEKNERLLDINELPDWAQPAFPKMKSLNRCPSSHHLASLARAAHPAMRVRGSC